MKGFYQHYKNLALSARDPHRKTCLRPGSYGPWTRYDPESDVVLISWRPNSLTNLKEILHDSVYNSAVLYYPDDSCELMFSHHNLKWSVSQLQPWISFGPLLQRVKRTYIDGYLYQGRPIFSQMRVSVDGVVINPQEEVLNEKEIIKDLNKRINLWIKNMQLHNSISKGNVKTIFNGSADSFPQTFHHCLIKQDIQTSEYILDDIIYRSIYNSYKSSYLNDFDYSDTKAIKAAIAKYKKHLLPIHTEYLIQKGGILI